MRYEHETGREIDYVLLWGEIPEDTRVLTDTLFRQVESYYDLVEVSKPLGLQRLYHRRNH